MMSSTQSLNRANIAPAQLGTPLTLPCGAVLTNRIAKAAMTEGLADPLNRATSEHVTLYRRWARNGFGMMLTGNIQVDRRHLERPGNIAIDDNGGGDMLRTLAAAGTVEGRHFWVQLNHPGRQTPAAINPHPLAPSAIALPMAEAGCGDPVAMTHADIADALRRFATAAAASREAGFTGVQIHAAHGYLVSQFLSPLANARNDEWGGSLDNRARFLIEAVRAVRAAVGADFPVAIKLNSADFQRGGFTEADSMEVVRLLDREGLDLIEISGGNYEQMQMVGLGDAAPPRRAASTIAREAYFLDYARAVRPLTRTPLMITGGMRSALAMNAALAEGACDVIGIGRPLCVEPDGEVARLLSEPGFTLGKVEQRLAMARDALGPDVDDATFKRIESFGLLGWFCLQLLALGAGREANRDLSVFEALIGYKENEMAAASRWQAPQQPLHDRNRP